MKFLSDEWLFPGEGGSLVLGIGIPCDAEIPPKFMSVNVWFDQTKLPDLNIIARRDGVWVSTYLSKIIASDEALIWNGPLPLFAVKQFSVTDDDIRAHLLGLANSFDDIDPPAQPMNIASVPKNIISRPSKNTFPFGAKQAPNQWNSLRGAAAMALCCVPTIGPWLQLLSEMLTSKAESTATASTLDAPWLHSALCPNEAYLTDQDPPLWKAIVHKLSDLDIRNEWKPSTLLNEICNHARTLGADDQRLEKLISVTESLLRDRGTIRELGISDNPLELALQLALLRPKPERYVLWKQDWPSVPPAAWWTGAILTGYICGFRSLPIYLRGTSEARRLLAIRTWQLIDERSSSAWTDKNTAEIHWSLQHNTFFLQAGKTIIATFKASNRGRWHELDLSDKLNLSKAVSIADSFCPEFLKNVISLREGTYSFTGEGQVELDVSQSRLSISGDIELSLGGPATVTQRLDIEGFRKWIATSAIQMPLPKLNTSEITGPQSIPSIEEKKTRDTPTVIHPPTQKRFIEQREPADLVPQGLFLIPDFITPKQESSLLAKIDSSPWDTAMTRRVQHYGWRYDYKSRKVEDKSYLGPLPNWAENLGKMLLEQGLVTEMPDQVIVNEYLKNQGITKHIDCLPCFRGEVVTISLLESWEMIFSRKLKLAQEEKYKIMLARRSAAVLSNEARTTWYHEIPKRLKEAGIMRHRRISVTFRKVNI
ncbi:alpha-ketoglutarate-dependent dioxygenase AlkB [Pseudomonas viridiflava]|uniref:alpha-ketoglutarate-dependent dioxygenase AlkB n=1 Tax=Pseudomonas viridiflava TaxID=33069 RepID=UPI0013D25A63|nr:alpha-ketoglutarate-dependent dioxygenase AlkB [Pseudomonas viridiflava]